MWRVYLIFAILSERSVAFHNLACHYCHCFDIVHVSIASAGAVSKLGTAERPWESAGAAVVGLKGGQSRVFSPAEEQRWSVSAAVQRNAHGLAGTERWPFPNKFI